MRLLPFLFLLLPATALHAQFSIGTWRDHLPYHEAIDVCVDHHDIVWCATPYAIFTYNPVDGEISRVSKINLLSDVGISCMEFDPHTKSVLVGYENGALDVIAEGRSANLPDIRLSSVLGDKRIYNIYPYQGLAYLSTGLGIVVVDLARMEVRSTYSIGDGGTQIRVNDVVIANGKIYAATDTGIRVANAANSFLADYQNWQWMSNVPIGEIRNIEYHNANLFIHELGGTEDAIWRKEPDDPSWTLFASYPGIRYKSLWTGGEWMTMCGDGVYQAVHTQLQINFTISLHSGVYVNANAAVMNRWGEMWVAHESSGLLLRRGTGEEEIILPKGPADASVRRIQAYNNNLWVAHGGVNDSWGNSWNTLPMSGFVDDQWTIVNPGSGANGTPGVNDFMNVAIDPLDNRRVMFGSWEEGLVERSPSGQINYFNEATSNSTLLGSGAEWAPGWTGVAGLSYDINGILWMSNSYSGRQLHARDRAGTFYGFDLAPVLSTADRIGDVLATQMGYTWAIVPGKGLMVFSTNGTLGAQSDDNFRLLTSAEGDGKLPSNDVLCMAEDLDSELWVGTLQGLGVFYNQDAIFNETQFDAEPILITQDGNVQILLETEAITAIRVDGGNRKWVGTQSSGVFLFSPDGLQQIHHFTSRNSPLFSDIIYDIAINQENGEVFFATSKGIISYFSTATNFDQEMASVRAYPNPVRPDYEGNITVDGLAYDTNVKFTDVQGNLVFETQSQGGRAVWDGRLLNGERPATGIYYVFAATRDGSVDNVAKIAIIR
jgi:hypothetical protein